MSNPIRPFLISFKEDRPQRRPPVVWAVYAVTVLIALLAAFLILIAP